MDEKRGEVRKIILKIQEYQKFVQLNRRTLKEIEDEGGDVRQLLKEVEGVEAQIKELQSLSKEYL
jgi:prefoldin subunit 5